VALWLVLTACGRTGLVVDESTTEPDADASVPGPETGANLDATATDGGAPPLEAEADAPPCEGPCRVGQAECDDGGIASCVADDAGCGAWGPVVSCPQSATCVEADGGASCRSVEIKPPRPIAPLSTSRVTSHRPTFHWVLAGQDDGAQVDVCRDRACTRTVTTFSAKGTGAAPAEPLAPGVYYWRLHGTEGVLTGTSTGPVWELTVPVRDTPVDTSWGTTLDVDGDGLADLAVGGSVGGLGTAGIAYVYRGSATGPSAVPVMLTNPPEDYDAIVGSAGDVNGDGFGDLYVGSPDAPYGNASPIGVAFAYSGGPSWASTAPELLLNPNSAMYNTYEFGGVVRSAGDVNGDGYGDILISDVDYYDTGEAYLYLGGPSGLSKSPTVLKGGQLVVDTAASDINGDGLSDVVLGVIGQMGSNAGEVDVYLGTPQGLSTSPMVIPLTASPSTQDYFLVWVRDAGDVNGDGYGDVLVGVPQMGANGSVRVYLGSAAGLAATPIVLPDPAIPTMLPDPVTPNGYWGDFPAGGGDIDGDGFDDIVVGIYGMPTGSAYVFRGGPSGVSTTPDATLTGPDGGAFGEPVSFVGDVNGDGFDDVAVGAYRGGDPIYVFLGSATGLSSAPVAVSPPAPDSRFGGSFQ
jgi:hypothetical protein